MAKMNKKWVTLCSTAIGAVYAAGYFVTNTQAQASIQPPPTQQIQVSPQTDSVTPYQSRHDDEEQSGRQQERHHGQDREQREQRQQPQTQQQPQAQSQMQQMPQAQTNPQSKAGYKDGTYQGSGSNRRGSIQVTVKIQNNKIADVEISRFAMHYSERDVVALPQEVVQNQSAQVRNVSGATYSTQAFKDAVQNALAQAQIS